MCHQVIEKIFKGYYFALLDEAPPYIHDLRILAVKADFWKDFSEEQQLQILELIPLQIEARYPEYKSQLVQALTEQKCKQVFENTRLLLEWTKEKILSEK
jgi:HEPN domain-containing protein